MLSQIPTVPSSLAQRQRHSSIHTTKIVFPLSTLVADPPPTLIATRPTTSALTTLKTRSCRIQISTPTISVLGLKIRSHRRHTSRTSSPRESRMLLVPGYSTKNAPTQHIRSSQRLVMVRPPPWFSRRCRLTIEWLDARSFLSMLSGVIQSGVQVLIWAGDAGTSPPFRLHFLAA
jgi:hypothetical protein